MDKPYDDVRICRLQNFSPEIVLVTIKINKPYSSYPKVMMWNSELATRVVSRFAMEDGVWDAKEKEFIPAFALLGGDTLRDLQIDWEKEFVRKEQLMMFWIMES